MKMAVFILTAVKTSNPTIPYIIPEPYIEWRSHVSQVRASAMLLLGSTDCGKLKVHEGVASNGITFIKFHKTCSTVLELKHADRHD
jgi:hypothetical protein